MTNINQKTVENAMWKPTCTHILKKLNWNYPMRGGRKNAVPGYHRLK